MPQVLGQVIALGIAAALSTVPISATIFILLSERRGVIAFPFLAGWVIGTAASVVLASLAAEALPGRPRQLDSLIHNLEILVGTALVLLGIVTLVRQRRRSTAMRPPDWLESIASFGALPAFGTAVALNIRPKALLLTVAAGLAIRGGHLRPPETLIVIAVYTAIATSTVVAPILATAFFPDRMEPVLVASRDWLVAHGAVMTAVIMILVGLLVVSAALVT